MTNPRILRRLPDRSFGIVVGVTIFLVGLGKNWSTIRHPGTEWGDNAANEILLERARHLRLLFGNYSRFGFNHPGPAILYVEAAGQVVFHNLLHVTTNYGGVLLGAAILNATMLGWAARLLRLAEGTFAVIAFLVAIAFQARAVPGLLVSGWMPYLYLSAFVLFTVALALVVAARREALVPLVVSTGLLIHGHISFALIVGLPLIVVLVLRRRVVVAWLRVRRTAMTVGVLIAAFLTPLVVNTFVSGPSFWTAYVHSREGASHAPRTALQSVRFVASFWRFWIQPSLLGMAVVGCVFASGLWRSRLKTSKGTSAWLTSLSGLGVLVFAYIHWGVDDLKFIYTGIFIGGFAAITIGVVVAVMARDVAANLPTSTAVSRWAMLQRHSVQSGALVFGGSLAAGLMWTAPANPDPGVTWVPVVRSAVKNEVGANTPVRLRFAIGQWPDAVTLFIGLRNAHVAACFEDRNYAFLVTKRTICNDTAGTVVAVAPIGTAPGPNEHAITAPGMVTVVLVSPSAAPR
jgi:hypothetical protein